MSSNPTTVYDNTILVEMCCLLGLSQWGTFTEWARMNPELIPQFILWKETNEWFPGWLKSYYEAHKFLFKYLLRDEPPCVLVVENKLEENYQRQAGIELAKYKESLLETEERAQQVVWFDDGNANKGTQDQGRLVHRLPQLTINKSVKRGRSRSSSVVSTELQDIHLELFLLMFLKLFCPILIQT